MEKEILIGVNPKVMIGKPVVKGTRITVELILERLALGQSINDLSVTYPCLTEERIQAALRYAPMIN
jgi:uncharacterized protein (DUF433 family)